MNNLSSYCGLVDTRIRASNKDLPVQWDKYWKKENNSDSEINSNNIDELGDNLDESDEDLEIVSIRPTFVQKLDDALKRSSESQTDPVQVRISEVLG